MIFKTKIGLLEINISDEEVKGKNLQYFLTNLKNVMSLDESWEENENMIGDYKITEDNYKKMILILFRIFANIPVILMGETGCGKTELIKQLMKMLNKDSDKTNNNFIIKNMHSGVKETEIKLVIDKAVKNLGKSKNDMVCIFFDEINTTSLLSKMKEIFVNHSLNGKPIDERIRFIGAFNPLRKNKNNEGDEGLKLGSSNDDQEEMTYMVNPLPNSLLNYIFYFKSLDNDDVKKYIESIIGKEFRESENSQLVKFVIEAIYGQSMNEDNEKEEKENPEKNEDIKQSKKIIDEIRIDVLFSQGLKNNDIKNYIESKIDIEFPKGTIDEYSKKIIIEDIYTKSLKDDEFKKYIENKVGKEFFKGDIPEIEKKKIIETLFNKSLNNNDIRMYLEKKYLKNFLKEKSMKARKKR